MNTKLLRAMEERYNFEASETQGFLLEKRHNHLTATYFLLEQQLKRRDHIQDEDDE